MIEITIGMYDPDGGEALPFTGCFWNGHINGYRNGYRNPSGKQEQKQEQKQKINLLLGAGGKTRLLRAAETKEVA